jgi:L-fuculokinase
MNEILLGVDVGATGIKAGMFSPDGQLLAVAGRRNGPIADTRGEPGWMVWDPEDIWGKVCECIRECLDKVGDPAKIKAVACTGFGTDGVPLDMNGTCLYPFVSWHCGRTVPQQAEMARRVGNAEIFQITGYHNYHINTANRLLWFRQNHPEILQKTHRWLQVQDYVAFRLSGEFTTECTIASTTMMLDMGSRTWSTKMLEAAEVDPGILSPISEAGTQIGAVTPKAASETGLAAGTPVVTGGHDCEIAVLGAGVAQDDIWIDITGTWEILIATVDAFRPTPEHYANGLDFECHALPGQWICQSLMIAGAVTEWVRNNFYKDVAEEDVYSVMFREAEAPSSGVYLLPSFMRGMGPDASRHAFGTILGLQTMTTRGQVVRAALEGLCFQLRRQVAAIGDAVGQTPNRLRVVGGGQKNPLWLQLKADVTGLPIEITTNPEVTLLGVAILAGIGGGIYANIQDAVGRVQFTTEDFSPDKTAHETYESRYQRVYNRLSSTLEPSYTAIDDELRT